MAAVTPTSPHQLERFRHEALLYAGLPEFVASATGFIRDGLAAGEPVLVVVSSEKIGSLRASLGADADAVEFADMADLGGNPARIIPAWRAFVDVHVPQGRRPRGIGEPVYPERSGAELVECQHHEVLLNYAFGESPGWWLLCPYDVDALEPAVVEEAFRSHPHVMRGGAQWQSVDYRDVSDLGGPFDDPLPEPHTRVEELVVAGPLSDLRRFVGERAAAAGLTPERTSDLVLAVSELAANSVRHAASPSLVRLWQEPAALVCEVSDNGRIEEPLAGRTYPDPGEDNGWGLWLVNQLCDLVQLRSSPAGTTVRLHMHLG